MNPTRNAKINPTKIARVIHFRISFIIRLTKDNIRLPPAEARSKELWHLRALDQKPEHDRQFAKQDRLRPLKAAS